MRKYKSFQETPVWAIAHQSALKIYIITKGFPKEELFGLVVQIRKSASSIRELIRFLYNARGSCGETIYHLILARDLGYINEDVFGDLKKTYDEIAKQLNGWINSLKARINH